MEEPSLSLSTTSLSLSSSSSSSSSNEASLLKRCEICLFDQPISSFCFTCSSHSFCQGCLSSYFNLQITEGKVSPLSCPSFNCDQLLDDNLVYEHAAEEQWQRFLERSFVKALEQMEDVFFCPNGDCNAPIWGSIKKKEGMCYKCKGYFCMNCKNPAHYGTCSHSILRINKEMASWLEVFARQCPCCLVYIEKNGGCDYLVCQRCNFGFYWSKTANFHLAPRKKIPPFPDYDQQLGYHSGKPLNSQSRLKACLDPSSPSKRCPNCNHNQNKTTGTNLLRCQNCKASSCFICSSFVKKGSNHFGPNGRCQNQKGRINLGGVEDLFCLVDDRNSAIS